MASLRDELQAVYDERRGLTAEILVEVAQPVDHPLHAQFEWDDTEAARRYRLAQATDLIRSIRITRTLSDGPVSMRAFLPRRGPDDGRGVYAPAEEVLADPVASAILLREFEREWMALRRRYGDLAEFAQIILSTLDSSDVDGLAQAV